MNEDNELILHESWSLPSWYDRVSADNWVNYEMLAVLNFSVYEIALYYNIDPREFQRYYNMLNSPLKIHYQAGSLKQQAEEGFRLIKDANSPNVMQGMRMDKKRSEKEFANTLDEVMFSEE